jgi:hypothetical protein
MGYSPSQSEFWGGSLGRKRQTAKHLPQRVYLRRGAYYWFPPKHEAERLGKTAIRLGKTLSEAMRQWAELAEGTTHPYTVSDLMDRYLIEVAPKKAERTYRDNIREVEPLRAFFGGCLRLPGQAGRTDQSQPRESTAFAHLLDGYPLGRGDRQSVSGSKTQS